MQFTEEMLWLESVFGANQDVPYSVQGLIGLIIGCSAFHQLLSLVSVRFPASRTLNRRTDASIKLVRRRSTKVT